MKKVNKNLKNFIKNVITLVRKPIMSVLPGELSFFLLLSIIPIILIIGIITSYFSVSTDAIASFINSSFPAGASSLILPLLSAGKGFDYNIMVLITSALLLVSKGTRSVMRISSIIYGVEDDNNIKAVIKSFILSILLVLLLAFIIIIPVLGTRILSFLHKFELIATLTDNIIFIYNILKWPISIIIIFIILKIIYKAIPNTKISSKSVNTGAMFTTILWTICSYLYSFYMTYISNYNIFFGSASNIIILMLWIYIISYIFVIGMSINANKNNFSN